jgi:hypothetical protein
MTANYLHELRTHGEIKVSRREVSNPWTITSPAATVNPMFRFLAPCLILLLFGCSTTRKRNPDEAQAPIIPAPYARVSQTESNLLQLEIAARMFVPAKKHRPVIWLTGVSHLGDQEYYDALQQHLDKVDLVLFEGIGDSRREDKSSHSGAKPAAQKPNDDPPEDLSHSLQSRMASALGLKFQLEAMDYDRANFQSCDLSVTELRDLFSQNADASEKPSGGQNFENLLDIMQGNSFWSGVLRLGLGMLGSSPIFQAMAKVTLIETLYEIQGDPGNIQGLPPDVHDLLKVLIEKRNQKVVDDIQQLPSKHLKTVAVFYGAGHMPDLEKRLRNQLHYRPARDIWFTAISVDLARAGVSTNQLHFLRTMIHKQLEDVGKSLQK